MKHIRSTSFEQLGRIAAEVAHVQHDLSAALTEKRALEYAKAFELEREATKLAKIRNVGFSEARRMAYAADIELLRASTDLDILLDRWTELQEIQKALIS